MRFSASIALALSGLVAASPVPESNPEELFLRQVQTLNAAMKAAGREYIGTSLTVRSDSQEQNIIKSEFGSITPENAQKWDQTEPSRGNFNFGAADQHVNWATQNGKHVRCHTLVWYSQLPSWVSNSNFNNATLIQVMTNHINTVMGRYRGKCNHWDVVNEALNEDGTYRDNVFLRVIGEAYIPIAFRIAAAADPAAKLYYNDYNLEYLGPKLQGAARIVKLVKSYGLKIDGVGYQAHLVTETTPTQSTPTPSEEDLTAALKVTADLGVDVAYTEIDIRMKTPSNAQKLQALADAYGRVARSCINVPRCVGMTIWGVSDKYSWVPQTFNGEGDALLWTSNYQKKAAYTSFLQGIQATPKSS
ncbi:NAD(P)H-dependent D-xylose reductase (XR) [Staphylotrichum longicolle]|uniref:Beta-xylanase n=1 Tax=Staphylotrichum longicolle TaxID=669026 RepID=A0AAD4ESA1_9PEZI|nr:NAD(P)H-dependent D-xylose reductase (XR) [Staphylotrichum longicolle]